MRRVAWFGLSAVLACALAHGNTSSVRKTAEASMLVTGHVQVNPDGTLHGYSIDQLDKLPAPVQQLIAQNVPHWRFQLDGPASAVIDSAMSVRVLAHPQAGGGYTLRIEGTSFDKSKHPGETITRDRQKPPTYPEGAIAAHVSGTVYLLLQIGRDGAVRDAIAEQVNLDQYGTPVQMKHFRRVLAEESLRAARQWTFHVPTQGPTANQPYWVACVPVRYNLNRWGETPHKPIYGQWQVYIPGPREYAPWVDQRLLSDAPDALADDALHELGSGGLQLKAPQS